MPKPARNGRIIYNRAKTGAEFAIKMVPEAAELISRYPGKEKLIAASENFKDYLDFQKAVNIGLKSICSAIRKKEAE